MSWETLARCHQYDPEIFFDPRTRSERKAKAICAKCPVRAECLALALQSHAQFGVWGGLNVKERRTLLRQAPKQPDWRMAQESLAVVR